MSRQAVSPFRTVPPPMRLAAALLLCAACGEPPTEGEDSSLRQGTAALSEQNNGARNGVVLWRGFNHWWEYNHRLNRLGDWVENTGCTGASCSAQLTHAAASGSGPDLASYKSWYTTVATSAAAFRTGSKVIPDAEMSGRTRHKVVLSPSHQFSRTLTGLPGYATAALAYTSILVDLDAQKHLLAWTAESHALTFPQ